MENIPEFWALGIGTVAVVFCGALTWKFPPFKRGTITVLVLFVMPVTAFGTGSKVQIDLWGGKVGVVAELQNEIRSVQASINKLAKVQTSTDIPDKIYARLNESIDQKIAGLQKSIDGIRTASNIIPYWVGDTGFKKFEKDKNFAKFFDTKIAPAKGDTAENWLARFGKIEVAGEGDNAAVLLKPFDTYPAVNGLNATPVD